MTRRNFIRTATAAAIFAPDIPAMLARATAPASARMVWKIDWTDVNVGSKVTATPLDLDEIFDRIYRVRSKQQSVIIYPYIERTQHTVVTKDYWLPKEVNR